MEAFHMAGKTITVKAAHPDRGSFHEVSIFHPNGVDAFVAGEDEVEVAETRGVLNAIAEGRIVVVSKSRVNLTPEPTDDSAEAKKLQEQGVAVGEQYPDTGVQSPQETGEGQPGNPADATATTPLGVGAFTGDLETARNEAEGDEDGEDATNDDSASSRGSEGPKDIVRTDDGTPNVLTDSPKQPRSAARGKN
jgi:hypothetical protein